MRVISRTRQHKSPKKKKKNLYVQFQQLNNCIDNVTNTPHCKHSQHQNTTVTDIKYSTIFFFFFNLISSTKVRSKRDIARKTSPKKKKKEKKKAYLISQDTHPLVHKTYLMICKQHKLSLDQNVVSFNLPNFLQFWHCHPDGLY